MQTTEQVARRPFHETIVKVIRRASRDELKCLATLIKETNVPKGYDEIIAVWNQRLQELGFGYEDLGVPASLLEQKEEAAEKEKAKAK